MNFCMVCIKTEDNCTCPEVFSEIPGAAAIVGLRRTDVIPFDQPCELGYVCPVCEYVPITDGEYDERLHWSEYNTFIWCSVCNKDYPSVLCIDLKATPDPAQGIHGGVDSAVGVYLSCIANAKEYGT